MKGISYIFLMIVALTGCSSTPPDEAKSQALIIAEQTYLTKDYTVLWSTFESPMKDFSKDDIDEVQKAFEKKSPGDISIFFGALSILSGNLTGVIDIAGGTAGNIASSDHQASRSNWVVAIPKNQAVDGLQARNLANTTIQVTAIEMLKEYGIVLEKVIVKQKRKATFGATLYPETEYQIKGTGISFGFYESELYSQNEKYGLTEGTSTLIAADEQYISSHETIFTGTNGFNKKYFEENNIAPFNGVDGYEQYLKELTKRLPDGYMYYMSPRSSSTLVPAIYTKGNKYNFIQPDVEELLQQQGKLTKNQSQ